MWGTMSDNNSSDERPGDEPEAEGGEYRAFVNKHLRCPKCREFMANLERFGLICIRCEDGPKKHLHVQHSDYLPDKGTFGPIVSTLCGMPDNPGKHLFSEFEKSRMPKCGRCLRLLETMQRDSEWGV